jgi:DNA polymerase-3 subunit delta
MNEIESDIKSGSLRRIYLIHGEELYMVKEYTARLKSAALGTAPEMLNLNVFEGKADVNDIINASETLPFMSDYRFVLVKDSKLFDAGRKDDTEALKEYAQRVSDTTVLCFVEDKVDKRNSLYKAVKKYGACVEFSFLKDNELTAWVCKKSDKKISSTVAMHLIKNVGTSMENLEGEIDKLVNYVSDGGAINEELVDELCSKSPETNIFEMVEAIGKKQPAKALEIYNNMLRMKQSPVYVLKMTARQFKLILECKYLQSKGDNAAAIAEKLSLRSFIVNGCLQQAKNFKMSVLVSAIKDCAKCDTDFKSGKISDRLGVEVLILKYSR